MTQRIKPCIGCGNYASFCTCSHPSDENLELLKRALAELKQFMEGECCDHDVGICFCSVYAVIDDTEEYIRKKEYEKAKAKIDEPPVRVLRVRL